jgi:predicted PurR-regulated permease PerM
MDADTTGSSGTRAANDISAMSFSRRALVVVGLATGVVLVLLFVWYTADLLMLVFAGVLVSILLHGFSGMLRRMVRVGPAAALAVVSIALITVIIGVVWFATAHIASQVSELWRVLPLALKHLSGYLARYPWAQGMVDSLPAVQEWFSGQNAALVSRLTGLTSTTLGAIVNVALVAFIGLYLAAQPQLYVTGVKRLFPLSSRERVGEVMDAIGAALWRWLGGRFGLMLINGGLTALGLWLLGVPLAFVLGVLAGVLNFIPNFGPWIAAVPAVMIALLQGPRYALYTAVLYLILQSVDGYILTPLVDRRSVELPPVLTITAQVLLGAAFGFVGILLASPFTAAAMIAIEMIYVEDVLGDRSVVYRAASGIRMSRT